MGLWGYNNIPNICVIDVLGEEEEGGLKKYLKK